VSFTDVEYDIASALLPITGTSFAGNALSMGILDSLIAFDGLSIIIVGQLIPDSLPTPLGSVMGTNTLAGATVTSPDPIGSPLLRQLTIPVNVPLQLDLQGSLVNASTTGSIIAYALVPEPTTALLLGLGLGALAVRGGKRASS
jgi:hypothetical protein